MEDNYYALVICILRRCTPEQAFELYYTGIKPNLPASDVEIMKGLRIQGLTYKKIGEIYNMSGNSIYKRIKKR